MSVLHANIDEDEAGWAPYISTGHLPPDDRVQQLLDEAHTLYLTVDDGAVADYIPALAAASRDLFGLCVFGVNGRIASTGDAEVEFSIQSVSKPPVFALVCDALGQRRNGYLFPTAR
ncbi:MAG: glutaminase [Thermomicrobiales bacterium]